MIVSLRSYWDSRERLDDDEILNNYRSFAGHMIDASHAVELEKLKSDSENHAQRRNYLMESNPVSVSHHLEMEALSKDDMSEIYLMADIFFAAQAWEYAYRLYVLILNS
jgi:hypothetical protein